MPDQLFCNGVLSKTVMDDGGSMYAREGRSYYKLVWVDGIPTWVDVPFVAPSIKQALKDD